MSAMTNYLEDALVDHVLRNTSMSSPSDVYLALFSSDPGESGDTTDELSGSGYSRQSISFDSPSDGATQNGSSISFTNNSGGTWNVEAIGIMDSDTGGEMLFYGTLDSSKTVADGDTITFDSGDIDITLD